MRFWRKFWLYVAVIAVIFLLWLFSPEFGRFECRVCSHEYTIGLYIICLALLSLRFIYFILKSVFTLVCSPFLKGELGQVTKSITALAKLAIADDYDFRRTFAKTMVVDELVPLKTALALQRNLCCSQKFEMTGVPEIDVHIMRRELRKHLDSCNPPAAVELAAKIIRGYAGYIKVARDELLETAILALKHGLPFHFEPQKFKYDLPQSYIKKFLTSLGIAKFEMEAIPERKLKILEKLHKDYSENVDVSLHLLNFLFANENLRYSENKMLPLVEQILEVSPDRRITKYLLKLGRSDAFEIAQNAMAKLPDSKEKLWVLLEIALERKLNLKIKELLPKLLDVDKSLEPLRFCLAHVELFTTDNELASMVQKWMRNEC